MDGPIIYFNKSTEIVNDKIPNRTIENAYVFLYDTEVWMIIGSDETLSVTTNPMDIVDPTLGTEVSIVSALPSGNNNIGIVRSIPSPNTTLLQGNLTLNGSAQQLSNTPCKTITIQSEPENSNNIYIGYSNLVSNSVHMYTISPSASATFTVSNANLLWVIGTSGDKICYGGEV